MSEKENSENDNKIWAVRFHNAYKTEHKLSKVNLHVIWETDEFFSIEAGSENHELFFTHADVTVASIALCRRRGVILYLSRENPKDLDSKLWYLDRYFNHFGELLLRSQNGGTVSIPARYLNGGLPGDYSIEDREELGSFMDKIQEGETLDVNFQINEAERLTHQQKEEAVRQKEKANQEKIDAFAQKLWADEHPPSEIDDEDDEVEEAPEYEFEDDEDEEEPEYEFEEVQIEPIKIPDGAITEGLMANPEYDSWYDKEKWRKERNKRLLEWTQNEDATQLILDISDVCELLDDVVDRDRKISRNRAERVTFEALIDIPSNPFLARHMPSIIPVLNQGIHAWCSANTMEQTRLEHDLNRAFVLRNVYGRIIHTVIELCRGREYLHDHEQEITDFFLAESLDEYKMKFQSESDNGTLAE